MPVALVVLVVVLAVVLSTVGGWFVTMGVLRLAARSGDAGQPAVTAEEAGDPRRVLPLVVSDGPEGVGARHVLRGGTWIGLLERLAVTGCFLVGEPSGVAVVVAVKGLGRYPELRENPGASERFVIGSMASLLWSAGIGFAAAALLR